jgi:hypothetical protein
MSAPVRKRHHSGSIGSLKGMLWASLCEAMRIVEDSKTPKVVRLRAISAVSTAGAVYAKLLEQSELEPRVEALEQALQSRRNGLGA